MEHTANLSPTHEYANAELLRELDEQRFVERAHGYLITHFPTLQPEERQDVIQDSYLRLLWRSEECRRHFRPFVFNATYLLAVVHTVALDFFRRAQRTRALFVEFDPWTNDPVVYLSEFTAPDVVVPSVEKAAQLSELVRLVMARIDRMPPRRRKAMELKLVDLTYDEIASVLGVSPNTIRNHLRTAREELRKSLPDAAMAAASL